MTIKDDCKYVVALSNEIPAFTSINIGDKETYSAFDKRTVTLLYEYYLLQVLTQYVSLTKNPDMVSRIIQEQNEDTLRVDFLIEEQLRFSESEQDFIRGDVNRLQTTVCGLLVSYIHIMMDSKKIIDISYDRIMDRIFKLKEREKDTFTDRLHIMTDEERAVDNILKINKLGVWDRDAEKHYVADDNDSQKLLMLKIAEMERKAENQGLNETDADLFMDEAMDDLDTQVGIDTELSMGHLNEDYTDGDPFGDEGGDQDE